MALRNQLPLERIRVFGVADASRLAQIAHLVIAPPNRQIASFAATNDRSNLPNAERSPLVLALVVNLLEPQCQQGGERVEYLSVPAA